MKGLLAEAEQVLRGPAGGAAASGVRRLLGFTVVCGAFYGVVMGSFGGVAGDRLLLVAFSGLKVPLLLLATFALSLPSFFVLNTLLGVRADFPEAVRALVSSQA